MQAPPNPDHPTYATGGAQAGWSGQNPWDVFLMGGTPFTGIIGDPGQLDRMYQWGFDRLVGRVPFPSFGAFSGFSTAYNTAYSEGGLYGTTFRDLAITSYAWQIQNTTGGPNAWWEANGSGPSGSNIWAGSHAGPQFGAVPYAWPIACGLRLNKNVRHQHLNESQKTCRCL